MRTSALALAALILALTAARTTLGQLPAGAKIKGIYSTSQIKQEPTLAQQSPASFQHYDQVPATSDNGDGQSRQPVQIVMYIPEPMPGAVQPAGHHHQAAAAPCYPGGGYGYGGPHGHGGFNPGYPGGPFHGGTYGYFGGAHRTPGYPHHHLHREYVGPQGPPTAAVAYPYYTVRGPRDFLMDNPPSIGR